MHAFLSDVPFSNFTVVDFRSKCWMYCVCANGLMGGDNREYSEKHDQVKLSSHSYIKGPEDEAKSNYNHQEPTL